MKIADFSREEHQKVIDAESRYGEYYVNAHNTTMMLSTIMKWPVIDCDIFIRFLSQMKKYHTLSMLATVRLHRIQAKMDLRYFLESTVNAAYALVHTDTKIYFDTDKGEVGDARKATVQAYRWIERAYGSHSKAISDIKEAINQQTAHANVVNSGHNFQIVRGESAKILTTFFDFDEERLVKIDLWQCGQAGLIAIDLILGVQKQHGEFFPSDETDRVGELIAHNEMLARELQS
jgi:hypothetical protein